MEKSYNWEKALSRPATGTFIKPHPGSIIIQEKTTLQKDKTLFHPASKQSLLSLPESILFIEDYARI